MQTQVITFHYTLTDKAGKTLDSSIDSDPLSFLVGTGQIISGLEKKLVELKKGDKSVIHVPYLEAYGAYDQKQVQEVEKKHFPPQEIKVGDVFQMAQGDHGQMVTVVEIKEKHIVLDANHPLAGKDLTFAVEVMDIRSATPEELSHGHAHGAGGHHHH